MTVKFSRWVLRKELFGVRSVKIDLFVLLKLNAKTVNKSWTTKTSAQNASQIASRVNLFALHVKWLKISRLAKNVNKKKTYTKMTFAKSADKLLNKYLDAKNVASRWKTAIFSCVMSVRRVKIERKMNSRDKPKKISARYAKLKKSKTLLKCVQTAEKKN